MPSFRFHPRRSMATRGRRVGIPARLIIALVIAAFSLVSYCSSSEYNPITGRSERVALSADQEVALGLQAAPSLMQQHGGMDADADAQALVDRIGQQLIDRSDAGKSTYPFAFHLLADRRTVNAFALPGGQIFITRALFEKLSTHDQLAAILAHEMVHVLARHGAQQLAKQQLTQGLSGAVAVGAGDYNAGRMAQMVGSMVNMKYGRGDEIESDVMGIGLMHQAGFNPMAMAEVMEILAEASQAAGNGRQVEFFSTHPSPDNRIARIHEAIKALP